MESLTPARLWTPRELRYRCTVIVEYSGKQCGKRFYEGEERAFHAHVARCARSHEGEIRSQSSRERMPGFYGQDGNFDSEKERWARRNREAIIAGTLKL